MNAGADGECGSRMCQPITQANCNRDRKTGSKSISLTQRRRSAWKAAVREDRIASYGIPDAR